MITANGVGGEMGSVVVIGDQEEKCIGFDEELFEVEVYVTCTRVLCVGTL